MDIQGIEPWTSRMRSVRATTVPNARYERFLTHVAPSRFRHISAQPHNATLAILLFLYAPHVKLQTAWLAGPLAEFDGWSVPKQGGERPDVLVLGLGFRVARLGSLPARDAEPVIRTSICLSLSSH